MALQAFLEADAQDERDRATEAEIERACADVWFLDTTPVTPPRASPPHNQDLAQNVDGHIRRRLSHKQPPPPAFEYAAMPPLTDDVDICDMAVAAECAPLPDDARRQHIHWTHSRTTNPADKQPEQFTREGFWLHLERVYNEVYPDPTSPTSSILQFGAVVKERHTASNQFGGRFTHHHATAFASKRHFWREIARISYTKYGVKLHAAEHAGYTSMYMYITTATTKKPIHEIDDEIYHSPHHPRGDELRSLLQAGHRVNNALGARKRNPKNDDEAEEAQKRVRSGDIYELVAEQKLRTVLDVQSQAAENAAKGDTRLAKFCTSVGVDKLGEIIRSATAVVEAPAALALRASSRMDRLRKAGSDGACSCEGQWIPGATRVLQNNGEDVKQFCGDVLRALDLGPCRGVNMALVGVPGCGKSMLFEPFDQIFTVMGKPSSKNNFPLSPVLDADVLLWQEYKHKDDIVLFEDLLAILVHERIEIPVPYKGNISHRNTAPMFFTSNSPLRVVREDASVTEYLNDAMRERFCSRWWGTPLPVEERRPNFPKCARCCALFYLGSY